MPPRSSLTSSFSITDSNNEVVCPLRNQDGSSCRKRCIGEKRYRSMQEHIRRAHPEHYISKLPATEESFLLMINTPPSERPPIQPNATSVPQGSSLSIQGFPPKIDHLQGFNHDRHMYDNSNPGTPRTLDDHAVGSLLPAASAAAALAQLHGHKVEPEWESEVRTISSHELEQAKGHIAIDSCKFAPWTLVNPTANSAPSWTYSTQETVNYGKRWEDLIDAADQAASAAGDIDEDRTPVPQSPVSIHRASLPPFQHHNFQAAHAAQSYQASPLQQALTPPSYNQDTIDPFPSVESGESGENFHIESRGLSDSSPSYSSQNTQIYCAACQSVSLLKDSYACTECICGLCQACVDVLMAEQGARRKCPRCATIGGRFKPFQLDIR
ncbi:hypothetical protein CGCA056_v010801 [Colletotrichum aenigma]|uniref:uncharacterized protein n=1 Tax=Colletotrichum aenigma TaxID=1215731 RepID=UPI00187323D7|nr:uncharacterized protein CGCA056_v010801 [Colletotrichum aenigma]KAF5517860.1 hypothetical protein CGCA056_v010801 [Colletotrichum aenigma]